MKNQISKYLLIRLLFLAAGLWLLYHFAFYLLPKNIQEDQFSFVGELDLIIGLSLVYTLFFSIFIFFEYLKFSKRCQVKLKKSALVMLFIGVVLVLVSLFLSFKL
ncbi:hypothetical protein ASE92_12310 [Pedobacter sp. Leaf41]|jgi:hypothetical protein|nr:hypothetical protein ASE92_12310 [Pedobacter sp. Leaf41]